MTAPITFTWTEDGRMVPLDRFRRACDRAFVVGETYPLVVQEERSGNSHRHYFASINEAWRNLPHDVAEQFPTPDHLRRRALIEAGFYTQEVIDCESLEVAERVAAFAGRQDEYALVAVSGALVVIRRAKSQSVRAMPKEEFQRSKQAVLEIIAQMVGVSAAELQSNADHAA